MLRGLRQVFGSTENVPGGLHYGVSWLRVRSRMIAGWLDADPVVQCDKQAPSVIACRRAAYRRIAHRIISRVEWPLRPNCRRGRFGRFASEAVLSMAGVWN